VPCPTGFVVRRHVGDRPAQRGHDGDGEDHRDHAQRQGDGHLPDVGEEHLGADEQQDGRQTRLQVGEAPHHAGEEEVQGPQPENGELVRGEDEERLVGHREDRRD
jgi:hypothetical protein